MNTTQKYVTSVSHATSHCPYSQQISNLIAEIKALSGLETDEVWQNVWQQLLALYGVDITLLPRREEGESLLLLVERYDLLDKVYQAALVEKELVNPNLSAEL